MKIRIVKPRAQYHFPCDCECSDPLANPMYLESDTQEVDIDEAFRFYVEKHLTICMGEDLKVYIDWKDFKPFSQFLSERLQGD